MKAPFKSLLPLLLLLTLPAAVQAQFNYTDNGDGTATITGYTGPGGDVTTPSTINGLQVTSIGERAFSWCTSLTSVTIPDSVTSIGDDAFNDCTSLTAITVDPLNPAYSSVDGVLFDKNQTTLIQCPAGKTGAWTIPDGVISIRSYAFIDCASLTNVTIPNSVISIGDWAFYYCSGLTSVTIGNGVTNIADFTFDNCTSLTSVTIPDSVTRIGDGAFIFCTSLISVTIPDSVTRIEDGAFCGCTSLTTITVDALNAVYSSVDGLLCDKSQTKLIQCPQGKAGNYTIPNSVARIGDDAFNNCRSLTSITIPNSVTSIGDRAFSWCVSLTAVYFLGDAPSLDGALGGRSYPTVYYLPWTKGWGTTYGGLPTALWNLPPVADASATEAWLVSANGTNATAVLNGSRSYDPSGDVLQYLWFSSPSSQPPTLLATGVVAVTVLPVGSHPINLVVSDGLAASTNSITVSVLTTRQAVRRLIALVNGSTIRHPRAILALLSVAETSIQRHHPQVAILQLRAFQCLVRVKVGRSDPVLAARLIQAAQDIIDVLSGGNTNPSGWRHGRFTSVGHQPNGRAQLQFQAERGPIYVVEASTNLVDWERIGVAVDHGNGMFAFEDANAARFPNRFYRVVSP